MAPRVVRPRSDSARWPVAAAVGVAALVVGYVGAAKVFHPPSASGTQAGDESEGAQPGGEAPGGDDDGGAPVAELTADAGRAIVPAAPAPPPPRVGVRVMHSILQSCGDGEELTTPGTQCGAVPGLESALAGYLPALGNCPAAEQAAAQREAVLSIGLRVDFTRHRVTALPGRSSSVRDPLTYVACARTALEHTDTLWQLHAPRARYLYFFAVRFGPVRAGAPTPVEPAPSAPSATPTVPGPAPGAVTPTPGFPAPAPGVPGGTPGAAAAAPAGAPVNPPEPASVVWQSGLLRDVPRTGAVVAHLAQGTAVSVVARQGSWWRVRVAHPAVEGWIYGEAIGR